MPQPEKADKKGSAQQPDIEYLRSNGKGSVVPAPGTQHVTIDAVSDWEQHQRDCRQSDECGNDIGSESIHRDGFAGSHASLSG
jgi:hypothetical protein